MKQLPRVILVGRTNVGKSTLFNRLIERPKALMSPESHTTRNVNIDMVEWQGAEFELVDSGGIETIIPKRKQKTALKEQGESFEIDIIRQTQKYLKTADLILLVVDTKEGVLPQDKEIASYIKKHYKTTPLLLVANKVDSKKTEDRIGELYALGVGEPLAVSAASGRGTGDMLDIIVKDLKKLKKLKTKKQATPDAISVAFIGKPNVGKSSLLNALLGEQKVIVSDIPGTTRESFDTLLERKDKVYRFIDTAGLRRKAQVRTKGLEKASVQKTIETAAKADVSLLMIDVSEPITAQDLHLAEMLIEKKSSIIIVANKWDLVPDKSTKTQREIEKLLYYKFPFLTWAPIIFMSAKTAKGVHHIYKTIDAVQESRHIELNDSVLSRFLKQSLKKHRPTRAKGMGTPYLSSFKQVKSDPPIFTLKIRKKDTLNPTYLRYLKNQLREKFNIQGTPLTIKVKQ